MNKKERKTGITIVTEKVLVKGEQKHKVLFVRCLWRDQLPVRYVEGVPYVEGFNNGIRVQEADTISYCVQKGDHLTEKGYQEFLEHCLAAGTRLKQINEQLREENKNWHGIEKVQF